MKFFEIFRSFKYWDKRLDSDVHNQEYMSWNIYEGKQVSKYAKRFAFVHYFLKYKIFVPLLYSFRYFFGKKLEKTIPKRHYNKNIIIFNSAYDKSVSEWAIKFCCRTGTKEERLKNYDAVMKGSSVQLLETSRDILNTIVLNDTAYREFINILMHNIAKEMLEKYKGKKVKHFMYHTDSIYDIAYYIATFQSDMTLKAQEIKDVREHVSQRTTEPGN